jgi:Na+/proline symporter
MQPVLIGIGAYLVVQFALGMLVSRRIASESDYLLAGRRLGVPLAAFSIFATWFGAETVVGAAGRIYQNGLSGGSADPFGYALCLVVLGVVIAVPLWRKQYTTFGDLFRDRYSQGVERLAVLLMVPTSVLWAAAQIRAFGQVVSVSSDIEVDIAITAAAAFVVIYTVAGGLLADVVTDFVQSIGIVIGLAILLLAVGNAHGGLPELVASIDPERLGLFSTANASPLELVEAWAVPVCGSLLAVEMLSRILGCKTAATARNATLIGAAIYLAVGLIPVTMGLVGPDLLPGLEEPEQLVTALAERHLSTFLYVLFAGALISAILSTVDSCLLAAGSLVSHNLIVPLNPSMTDRQKVRTARIGVAVFGLIAYVIALYGGTIYELVETASALGSAGIFVVGLFGLFSRRLGGAPSAYAALITGVVVWAAGEYWLEWSTPYVIALAASLAAYLLAAAAARRAPVEAHAAERAF